MDDQMPLTIDQVLGCVIDRYAVKTTELNGHIVSQAYLMIDGLECFLWPRSNQTRLVTVEEPEDLYFDSFREAVMFGDELKIVNLWSQHSNGEPSEEPVLFEFEKQQWLGLFTDYAAENNAHGIYYLTWRDIRRRSKRDGLELVPFGS